MNKDWLFNPPADNEYFCKSLPSAFVDEILEIIVKISSQGKSKQVFEHYKKVFCSVSGNTYYSSSDASWAKTDLDTAISDASENGPGFIVGFLNSTEELANSGFAIPTIDNINSLFIKHNIGFFISFNELKLREYSTPAIQEKPELKITNINEQNIKLIMSSLERSEELLNKGYCKEAVQESLWLLETIVTGFKGLETESGKIEGKYFNTIIKELKKDNTDSVFSNVLSWITSLHGFLSSPTGGGVRHGTDLKESIVISNEEARLYFNLIRSYTNYLIFEYNKKLYSF